jgi:hypothetical protein
VVYRLTNNKIINSTNRSGPAESRVSSPATMAQPKVATNATSVPRPADGADDGEDACQAVLSAEHCLTNLAQQAGRSPLILEVLLDPGRVVLWCRFDDRMCTD